MLSKGADAVAFARCKDALAYFWGYSSGGEDDENVAIQACVDAGLSHKQIDELIDWLPDTTGATGQRIRKLERRLKRL